MLQNGISLSKQVAIVPTLIICQGKFGRAVGLELVDRLSLMQAALTQEGFTDPLIARADNNGLVPGLIRIMELDWEKWLSRSLEHVHFLRDIEIPNVSGSRKISHRLPISPLPDPGDVNWMLDELSNLKGRFRAACEPLRFHHMHKLGVKDEFRLRLIIVCSAREGTIPILTHNLVKVLGDFYITEEKLTSGIQMFCYVGGTSMEEHIDSGGTSDEYEDPDPYTLLKRYTLLKKERELVLGRPSLSTGGGPKPEPGFLKWLMWLWDHSNPDVAHILESCYLLDAQLANGLVPTPEQLYEPSEVVLATTLALMSFIATNADLQIRQLVSRRSTHAANPPTNPPRQRCLFASFGIASYSVDHPKLHRLVHSWLIDDFLCRVLHLPSDPMKSSDSNIVEHIQKELEQLLVSFRKNSLFEVIDQLVVQKKSQRSTINFAQLVNKLDKSHVTSSDLNSALGDLATEVSPMPTVQYLQAYQQWYVEALGEKVAELCHQLYEDTGYAPLTSAYWFLQACFDEISRQTDPSLDPQNVTHQQQSFVVPLDNDYQNVGSQNLGKVVKRIKKNLYVVGIALVIVAVVAVIFLINIPLFLKLFVIGLVGLALVLSIHALYTTLHRQRIQHTLKQLEKFRKMQLQETRKYAWKWALVQFKMELQNQLQHMQHLCEPDKEIITTLRQELQSQSPLPKEHILERMFLDDQLIQELKRQFVENPDEPSLLWERRVDILKDIEALLRNQATLTNTQKALKIERFLRDQVEKLYQQDGKRITSIISSFLEKRDTPRLDEIYHTLSEAAVPLLNYTVDEQDASIVHFETFGVYGKKRLDAQDIVTRYPHIHVMNSVDRLHWLFMRGDVGIHFDQIDFSIASLS